MFNPESLAQLKAAGDAFEAMIEGLSNGFNYEDVSAAFATAMASKEVVDELKADKSRAVSCIVGSALTKYGAS